MLYNDGACIMSRSPRGLERMSLAFVEKFDCVFGLINVHADPACAGNADSLQRHGASVTLDNLLPLFGRRRH